MYGRRFIFPLPHGNRELHMLDKCKAIAKRAKLDPARLDLFQNQRRRCEVVQ